MLARSMLNDHVKVIYFLVPFIGVLINWPFITTNKQFLLCQGFAFIWLIRLLFSPNSRAISRWVLSVFIDFICLRCLMVVLPLSDGIMCCGLTHLLFWHVCMATSPVGNSLLLWSSHEVLVVKVTFFPWRTCGYPSWLQERFHNQQSFSIMQCFLIPLRVAISFAPLEFLECL